MKPTKRYVFSLVILILLSGLYGCSRYAEIPDEEVTISNEDLSQLKKIQEDISRNFDAIADSNGYFGDRFYFDTDRLNRNLKCMDADNVKAFYKLYRKGTIKSIRIIDKECCTYLLKFAEAGSFDNYADEAWLIYHKANDLVCSRSEPAYGKMVWQKVLDENWTLIKNKRTQYHRF